MGTICALCDSFEGLYLKVIQGMYVETKSTISFYYFSFTHTLVVCPFHNNKLKRLEVFIRFLRLPECPFFATWC